MSETYSKTNKIKNNANDFATFGAIHLNVTNLEKSTSFYTNIVGLRLRKTEGLMAELGTETKTLVILQQTAKTGFKKGYSGLYHFAIHAPNEAEFASMFNRLLVQNYPISPVDHTMSKSVYLDDPDGINVEFTLETPERFKRVVADGGLRIEDINGLIKSASDLLDIHEVMKNLHDKEISKPVSNDTYLGHLHLYANNVQSSKAFYKSLGFDIFNDLPQFAYTDLGAGGAYQHRIALNAWHGQNKPLAPADNAGMIQFNINIRNTEKFKHALANLSNYEVTEGGFLVKDPTGNKILLTNDEL
jgi:catechol 2,3-dioxygenase